MTNRYIFRSLKRYPFLHGIKILGLSLAISTVLLIFLFLKYELTYDQDHSRSEDIFRLTTTSENFLGGKHFARLFSPGYVPGLKESFPGVESFVRLAPVKGGAIKYEEQYISIEQGFECDSTFFEVFDAEFLIGSKDLALKNPGEMIVSESFALRVFGETNPIGKVLTIPSGQYYGENTSYTIQGIMKDFPGNSHFHPEYVATPMEKGRLESWGWTYLLFYPEANPEDLTSGFKEFVTSYYELEEETRFTAHLQPLKDIHLHSHKTREIEANSNMKVVISFSLAAILLLFIALINYANLNRGMAVYADRFLRLNRLFGASRRSLLRFFIAEVLAIVALTFVISTVLFVVGLVLIKQWFLIDLWIGNIIWILLLLFFINSLIIVAGVLSQLGNSSSGLGQLRNHFELKPFRAKGMSKGLIVFQNLIAIALIIAVISIQRQTVYAIKNSMNGGENKMVCFEDVHTNVQQKFVEFKNELLTYHSIDHVSAMFEPPGGEANDMFNFTMEDYIPGEGQEENDRIGIFPCDYSFASIFDLDFLAGQNFSEAYADNEGSGEYIVNESAMYRLRYNDPDEIIGKDFGLIFGDGETIKIPSGKIIGVVADFHHSSLKREIDPLVFFKRDALWLMNFLVSFKPGLEDEGVEALKAVWKKMFPEYPFEMNYVDAMYEKVYADELLQTKLLTLLTIIAMIVISMGLLALSLLTSQRRIKEVGIRRVHGAETGRILMMLNWDFLKWIILAFVLAVPFSYFFMTRWLEAYAYRVSLAWWIFALAGVLALLVASLTVSIQTWKVANRNPVEALRYE